MEIYKENIRNLNEEIQEKKREIKILKDEQS